MTLAILARKYPQHHSDEAASTNSSNTVLLHKEMVAQRETSARPSAGYWILDCDPVATSAMERSGRAADPDKTDGEVVGDI